MRGNQLCVLVTGRWHSSSRDSLRDIFKQFINLITTEKQKIGKGLQSCTSEISVVEANIGEKRIVIIDTPGIDDTRAGVKETDVFTGIADLLEAM